MLHRKLVDRLYIHHMPYGVSRRAAIIKWMTDGYTDYIIPGQALGGLPVNRRGCGWLSTDPDVNHLLKCGSIKRTRVWNRSTGTTYMVLA